MKIDVTGWEGGLDINPALLAKMSGVSQASQVRNSGLGQSLPDFESILMNQLQIGESQELLDAFRLPQQKEDKLKKTAAEFEAMLMTQMFQALRKTVEPSGLFPTNQTARSTYEYLLDQATFQKAAENGYTWGLAERLEESWRAHFEAQEEKSDF